MKHLICYRQGASFREVCQSPWQGEVSLVTHSGWYLKTCHNDILLLHDATLGEVPIGAALPYIRQLPYDKQLEQESVSFQRGILTLPQGYKIKVFLSEPREPLSGRTPSSPRIQFLKSTLMARGKGFLRYLACAVPLPEISIFSYTVCQCTQQMRIAAKAGYPGIVETAVKNMLGLGLGLTPSCDDWLAGYLYTLSRMGVLAIHEMIADIILRYIRTYTNEISAAYLKAVIRGDFYEMLERCLFSLEEGPVFQLLEVGSSSGSDMLSGMVAAWDDWSCFFAENPPTNIQ